MTKYYLSSDKSRLKVEKEHWYLKDTDGNEKELPFPSTIATDIILENNEISEEEYEK